MADALPINSLNDIVSSTADFGPGMLLLIGRLGQQRVALPVFAVERVLPMVALTKLPELPGTVAGVLNLHGTILPVVDPRPQFGLPTPPFLPSQRLVVLRAHTRFVLWLDSVDQIVTNEIQRVNTATPDASPMRAPLLTTVDGETMPVLWPFALAPGHIIEPLVHSRQV